MGYTIPALNSFSMLSSLGDTIQAARANSLAQDLDLRQRNEAAQDLWRASGSMGDAPAPITSQESVFSRVLKGKSPLPSGTGSQSSIPSGDQQANYSSGGGATPEQHEAYQYYTSHGFAPNNAAALVATQTGESGPHLKSSFDQGGGRAGGDTEDRSGISNWNGPRVTQLRNFAAIHGLDPTSRQAQYAFTAKEISDRGLPTDSNGDPAALTHLYTGRFEQPAVNNGYARWAAAPGVGAYGGGRTQLAGPMPTPDTVPARRSSSIPGMGLQTGAYNGQAYTSAVPGGPQSAQGFQGGTRLAGPVPMPDTGPSLGSNPAPVPATGDYGAPSISRGAPQPVVPGLTHGYGIGQDGIPLPPPRPESIGVPPTHGFNAGAAAPPQGIFASLANAIGGGSVVPDGQGGYVPSTNSRINPDGSFGPSAGPNGPSVQVAGPSMYPSRGAAGPSGVPMAGAGAATTPYGQRMPKLSLSDINRMINNQYSTHIGKALLEQYQKENAGQLIDLPVGDADGKFAGTQKAYVSPNGQVTLVPGGAVDTSKIKETSTNDIKNYEYQQAHPEFQTYETETKAGKAVPHVVNQGGTLVDPTGKVLFQNKAPTVNPETVDMLADRVIAGDSTALQNLGRGAQGGQVVQAVQQRVAEKAAEQGLQPTDILSNRALQAGRTAGQRTAGAQAAKMLSAGEEAKTGVDLAEQASNALPRSDWVPWNKAVQLVEAGTSSPELMRFNAANNTLVNEYSRAINPNGVGTVSDKDHAREMLSTAMGPDAYSAVLSQMRLEMGAATQSPAKAAKILDNLSRGRPALENVPQGATPIEPAPTRGGTPTPGQAATSGTQVTFGSLPMEAQKTAIIRLKQNPALRNDFDMKFGAGASDQILGPPR